MPLPKKCPLCHSGDSDQFVVSPHVYGQNKDRGHSFYHCRSCDIRYQYPGLTLDEEHQFYADEFEKFMETRSGISGGWQKAEEHVVANEDTRQRRMAYLSPHLAEKLDILEIF